MTNLPIDLRHAIVYPAIVYPKEHVGIEVVVVLQTSCLASHGRTLLVSVDAEGRHSELNPRLHARYGVVELLYEEVDVVSAPVANVVYPVFHLAVLA